MENKLIMVHHGEATTVRNEAIDPKLHISGCHLQHEESMMAFPKDSDLHREEIQICLEEFMLPDYDFPHLPAHLAGNLSYNILMSITVVVLQ